MNLLIEEESNNISVLDDEKSDNDYEEDEILVNFNVVCRECNKFFLFDN